MQICVFFIELSELFSFIQDAVNDPQSNSPLTDVTPGEVVLAYNQEVEDWDRVVILQLQSAAQQDPVWKVRSIDYGNEYGVSSECLRPITEDLLKPSYSAKVILKGIVL